MRVDLPLQFIAKLRRQELRYNSHNPEQDKMVLIRTEGGKVTV